MLKPAPPMTAYQRVLAFRERNPGYARRDTARRRARVKSGAARLLAEHAGAAEAAEALVVKPVLMLPAPVQDPVMEAINALAAKLKAGTAREALPVAAPAVDAADKSVAA